jgi:enoyl-CoA hydratase/carnithine racemase
MAGIAIEQRGAVQVLRFDRPEKKNALSPAMYEALAQALEASAADESVGVTVFLGAPGIFTAGNDIGDFVKVASEGRFPDTVLRFLRALAAADRPLMAGVDGLAVGVGATILMHCDYVLATPRAVLRTPFTALGLVPEAASSLLAPRAIGHKRAFELLVMGRDMKAEAALQAGFFNALVAAEALESAVLAAAEALAARPREAVLASRRLLKGDPAEILARIEVEAEIFAERLASREAQAAFAAFMGRDRT